MARSLEFISIGEQQIDGVPLRCVPFVERKSATELYQRRVEAVMSSTAEYLCFVDGGADLCLPGFADAMQALADTDAPLGYAAELVHGKQRESVPFTLHNFLRDHSIIHHGVVCKRSALQRIEWPQGCYSFEVVAYGTLAQQGFAYDSTPRYDWRPGPGGARTWPTYPLAVVYGKRWLQGLTCINAKSESSKCHQ